MHGRRRIGLADGGGDRDRSATDAHSDGVSGERAIGRLVESDVEYYERYKLFGIRTPLVLASKGYNIPSGQAQTLTLRLPKGVKLLARQHKIAAVAQTADGSRALTLKFKK